VTTQGRVLFLCPHNAPKSVLAVVEFDRLAQQRGLSIRADSAGTEPEAAPSPAVVAALRADGIDVANHRPRLVTREDFATADRIITLGCDIGALVPAGASIVSWDDVPPVSRDLEAARTAIRQHVEQLVAELAAEQGQTSYDAGKGV
jgi:arsenate reductase (thioredoxin)